MDAIHHYTNINTLSLILKHKSIRFNRLDRVDDVTEAEAYGKYELGKFLFVSCWTDSQIESIPLWHIYTDKMRGVRITLDTDWMHYRPLRPDPKWKLIQKGDLYSPVPFERFFNDNYIILPNFFERNKVLKKVHYVADPAIYFDNAVELTVHADGKAEMKIEKVNDFATYKQKIWEFQSEMRFVFFILPGIKIPDDGPGNNQYISALPTHILNSIINGIGPNIEYFDVDINPDILNNIAVTLGPLCDESDEILVDSLLKKYTSNGTSQKSKLTGNIRKAIR